MEITAVQFSGLQAAIEAARQKNSALRPVEKTNAATSVTPVAKTAKTQKAAADVSIQSSGLVNKLYGNKEKKQEQAINIVGSRFDAYA